VGSARHSTALLRIANHEDKECRPSLECRPMQIRQPELLGSAADVVQEFANPNHDGFDGKFGKLSA
jgi:hypothetical protein